MFLFLKMSSDWQNEVNICFKNRKIKIKPEEKKRNTVSLFGVHRIRSGRARKMCYAFSPVFSWKGTRGCVGRGKNCRVGKTKDVNLDFREFKC